MSDQEESPDPISYRSAQVVFSKQFTSLDEFRNASVLLERDRDKAQDLGIMLFFVFSPRSVYRNMPESERLAKAVQDKRFRNKEWVLGIIEDPRVSALIEKYCDLVRTPAIRLWNGMIENIDRFLKEISTAVGNDETKDPEKMVDRGVKLFEQLKKVEALMAEESKRKTRAGYAPKLFERIEQNT